MEEPAKKRSKLDDEVVNEMDSSSGDGGLATGEPKQNPGRSCEEDAAENKPDAVESLRKDEITIGSERTCNIEETLLLRESDTKEKVFVSETVEDTAAQCSTESEGKPKRPPVTHTCYIFL